MVNKDPPFDRSALHFLVIERIAMPKLIPIVILIYNNNNKIINNKKKKLKIFNVKKRNPFKLPITLHLPYKYNLIKQGGLNLNPFIVYPMVRVLSFFN